MLCSIFSVMKVLLMLCSRYVVIQIAMVATSMVRLPVVVGVLFLETRNKPTIRTMIATRSNSGNKEGIFNWIRKKVLLDL